MYSTHTVINYYNRYHSIASTSVKESPNLGASYQVYIIIVAFNNIAYQEMVKFS